MITQKKISNFVLIFWIPLLLFFLDDRILQNDYLNPYTLTFKNPKTLQMFNIMILYHYVMAFLLLILIFTFIFIFLSFFRSYFFFHFKPFYRPTPITLSSVISTNFFETYTSFLNWIRYNLLKTKFKNISFYKADVLASLKDKVTHAPVLEFLWVVIPALILICIAYPSIVVLYYNEMFLDPLYTISVIGNQWYWSYEYNDFNLIEIFKRHVYSEKAKLICALNGSVSNIVDYLPEGLKINKLLHSKDLVNIKKLPLRYTIDCNLLIAKDPKLLRLLTTDRCLVVPAKVPIRFLITSADVIHSWAIPSYGIKMDAVPGRLNQIIIQIPLMGTSWGQCSELCGVNHAYMPIEIKVLHHGDFLFYIRMKISHILLPHLKTYYLNRIKIIKYFLSQAKIWNEKNPDVFSVSRIKEIGRLNNLLNLKINN